jgi:hypothetical protein
MKMYKPFCRLKRRDWFEAISTDERIILKYVMYNLDV